MSPYRLAAWIVAALTSVAVLTGCVIVGHGREVIAQLGHVTIPSPSPVASARTIRSPVDPAVIPFRYTCSGVETFQADDLAGSRIDVATLGSLDEFTQSELATLAPGSGWRLVSDTPTNRLLVQVVDPIHMTYVRLELREGSGGPTGRVWAYAGSGDCEPRALFHRPGGVGGFLRLDPAAAVPGREARTLHLIVNYLRGCPSAVRIMGRPRVVMTPDAVLVGVPVRARVNSDVCHVGEPVPITVHLTRPLGDRTLYDASTLPIRRLRLP